MTPQPRLIKFDVCLYKKEDVSFEDFSKWATEVYLPLAKPIMKRHGIVKWAQSLLPSRFREPMRAALKDKMKRLDWSVPDYDMVMSYWVPSMDVMTATTTDPGWIELEKEATKRANISVGHFIIDHQTVRFEGNE